MMDEGIIIICGSYLLLFSVGEFMYHIMRTEGETSRKVVHAGSGIIALFLPELISDQRVVFVLAVLFSGILYLSLQFDFLKSINAVSRNTLGSVCFPVILYVCYLGYMHYQNLLYYYTPILVLSVSDPLAAIVGKKWPYGVYHVLGNIKSFAGSLAFLFSCMIITLLGISEMSELNPGTVFLYALLISVSATITEGISVRGFDNILVPLVVLGLLVALV